jgi:hypothetical protein
LLLLGLGSFGGATYLAKQSRSWFATTAGQDIGAGHRAQSLSIRVSPDSRSVERQGVARFTVRIRRKSSIPGHARAVAKQRRNWRIVNLRVVNGLPRGATATFRPERTRKSISTLIVKAAGAASGRYRIRVGARNLTSHAIASAHLIISPRQPAGFTISGDSIGALAPGLAVPLDLTLANPGPSDIAITGLKANVTGVGAPKSGADRPCTVDDFSVVPFSGAYGFTLGSSRTTTLSQLNFPAAEWPQLKMLNRPVNQDGCKGASLTLSYSGTSTDGKNDAG